MCIAFDLLCSDQFPGNLRNRSLTRTLTDMFPFFSAMRVNVHQFQLRSWHRHSLPSPKSPRVPSAKIAANAPSVLQICWPFLSWGWTLELLPGDQKLRELRAKCHWTVDSIAKFLACHVLWQSILIYDTLMMYCARHKEMNMDEHGNPPLRPRKHDIPSASEVLSPADIPQLPHHIVPAT